MTAPDESEPADGARAMTASPSPDQRPDDDDFGDFVSTRTIDTTIPQYFDVRSLAEQDPVPVEDDEMAVMTEMALDGDIDGADLDVDGVEIIDNESVASTVGSPGSGIMSASNSDSALSRHLAPPGLSPGAPSTPESVRSSTLHSIDRRFHTRLSSVTSIPSVDMKMHGDLGSPLKLMRAISSHSTGASSTINDPTDQPAWEPIKWSKLRRISNQIYSEAAVGNYGHPTVIQPASHFIAFGMTRGQVLVFDYQQNLKQVLGVKARVAEWGEVTSLAISSDQTYIGVGYDQGHIITWDLGSPNTTNIHITPRKPDFAVRPDKDGHVLGSAVIHLSFVDKRHSALISADAKGMAFAHDTLRSIRGRIVKSKRILGRYRQPQANSKAAKPTTVFSCAPRPLGTNFQHADSMGLVALITPYLLVVISTTPHLQTQLKLGRAKDATSSMGVSACLAWFPSLRQETGGFVNSRLAYCWSNVVQIIELVEVLDEQGTEPKIHFSSGKKFVCDESIVALQWINTNVLLIVTVTQRLLILNEDTMKVSEMVDILNKHMVHHDYFSYVLHELVVRGRGSTASQPAVLADAFYNSIKTFKGRIYLMGKYEFVLGSLSNWADRLLDVMESGDHIKAIKLATSYFVGDQDLAAVGLPKDAEERHAMVQRSLPDLVMASINYTLRREAEEEVHDEASMKELLESSIAAVVAVGDDSDLIGGIYEKLEQSSYIGLFFDLLSTFIYDGEVKTLPPNVFKDMVLHYSSSSDVLEDLICRLSTDTLDLDLTFSLSRQYHLRDTQTYVTNCALHDFVTPLDDFVSLIYRVQHEPGRSALLENEVEYDRVFREAEIVYPYLSYVLTGRVYPTAAVVADEALDYRAKSTTYYLLFSGSSGKSSAQSSKHHYLKALIEFNGSAFFAAMNEAFEDSFLNESSQYPTMDSDEMIAFGATVSRQLIINSLLEAFAGESSPLFQHRIFFNIFIARNYPKYPQFILLPGNVLGKVLDELCYCPNDNLREECELAINSLLTNFKPPDLSNLVSTLFEVQFYTSLEQLFRAERRFARLAEVSFLEYRTGRIDGSRLMDILNECFSNTRMVGNTKDRVFIDDLVQKEFETLELIDCDRLVAIVSIYSPHLHEHVFQVKKPELQFEYLKRLFNTMNSSDLTRDLSGALVSTQNRLPSLQARNLYVSLLAQRGMGAELNKLLSTVLTGVNDVELPNVVDDLISSQCIDSLVLLLNRQDRIAEAIIYLLDHIAHVDDEYQEATNETDLDRLESELSRYTSIGVDLCRKEEKLGDRTTIGDRVRQPGEQVWVRLLDGLVDLLRVSDDERTDLWNSRRRQFKHTLLRTGLSSLLDADSGVSSIQHDTMIVQILRSILSPETTKLRTMGTLRPLLNDLFSAYHYQHTMLRVAQQLLDSESYLSLLGLVSERLKGWKVSRSGECEGCGRKIIGVGVDAEWLYNQWEHESKKQLEPAKLGRKDKLANVPVADDDDDILVVFKCGHTYHMGCLRRLGSDRDLKCIMCD